jgi:hypothetical protein
MDGFRRGDYVVAYDARTGKIIKKGTNGIIDEVGIPKKYTEDKERRIVGEKIVDLPKIREVAKEATRKQLRVLARYGLHPAGFESHICNMALHRAGVIEYDAKLDDARLIDSAVDNVAAAIKQALLP